MNALELIETIDKRKRWYWLMDYRHQDDKGGTYMHSESFKTELDAIKAMADQKVKWELLETHREEGNKNV